MMNVYHGFIRFAPVGRHRRNRLGCASSQRSCAALDRRGGCLQVAVVVSVLLFVLASGAATAGVDAYGRHLPAWSLSAASLWE